MEQYRHELIARGIRPSNQRLKVLEYFHHNPGHPTADEIFRALSAGIPPLSKATIYNVLHTFCDAGILRMISIDENELRYDFITDDHGHFHCEVCGSIFNFFVAMQNLMSNELESFQIHEKNVFFKGICPRCISNDTNPRIGEKK